MFSVGFRDLQWRLRRFVIGVIAIALVFSLTLVLAGISAFFHNEIRRTVKAIDVDAWIVPKGVVGPFTSTQFLSQTDIAKVEHLPGISEASPLVLFRQTVRTPKLHDVNIIGVPPGGLGAPKVSKGVGLQHSGDIVVDSKLGAKIGDELRVQNRPFHIVGTTTGLTYFGGSPVLFIPIQDAQKLLFQGLPYASTVVVKGTPTEVPTGFQAVSNATVRADLYRPIAQASNTIQVLDVLLLLIAAGIVGAILYMSTLERIRDFAVMKATGASNGFVLAGLLAQSAILSFAAAAVAVVLALLIAPTVPSSVEIPTSAYVALAVTAVVVGIVGSLAGLRRAVSVDPALAFGA